MTRLATLAFIATLFAPVPAQADPGQPAPASSTLEVFVWLEDNSEPGVPVSLVGRAADGTVLLRAKTDAHGRALLTLRRPDRESLVRIEAFLMMGGAQEYGALQSLGRGQGRICIHLPRYPVLHCQD